MAWTDIKSSQKKLASPVEVAEDRSVWSFEASLTGFETNGEKSMISNGIVKVFGKLCENECPDVNFAVKEYLMVAGYKISVFQEEDMEALVKEKNMLHQDKQAVGVELSLAKTVENLRKDVRERDISR